MDNDNLRRGKLTTHKKFSESTAILAGNSLLTIAFQILSEKRLNLNVQKKIKLINLLSESSGHSGIAGGQFLDLSYEKIKKKFAKCGTKIINNFEEIKTQKKSDITISAIPGIDGLKPTIFLIKFWSYLGKSKFGLYLYPKEAIANDP